MDGKLAGKVAIVTGGSEGIGAASARGLAAEGARVAIVNRSHADRAAAPVAATAAVGASAAAFAADCSYAPAIEAAVESIVQRFGGVDILVNNAGIFRPVPIEATTEEVWDSQLDLNLSRALALELAARNINVNVLAPGNIATAMNDSLRQDETWRVRMRERTPSGDDFLSVDDLVDSVLFLVGEGARKMHGQVLCVDGGWTAWVGGPDGRCAASRTRRRGQSRHPE
jgi:NAD(P)-dependent dehydrogenase (short-subunit alcohol dehydrogenase family)